ncbi:tetratricopeptide repeat protein [Phenylobacterium sp.]|uniref:tetratricopeptide repeat protein n=1 Tax=Phenylobacterium sp. TaxID=1871053 RepID=UPI00391B0A29
MTEAAAVPGGEEEAALLDVADKLEAAGDIAGAYAACSRARKIATSPLALSARMGRLALELGHPQVAETLLTSHTHEPSADPAAVICLAQAQSAQQHFDRAHATLKAAIEADPGQPLLWCALGDLLFDQGRHAEAIVFIEEALRLDPNAATARHRLAEALLRSGGDLEQVLGLGREAVAAADGASASETTASHARHLLAAGRLDEGWPAFVAWSAPGPAAGVRVRVAAPHWDGGPFNDRLLVLGEEDVADELLLAHVLSDIATRRLILAVDERWHGLAARAFSAFPVVNLLRGRRGSEHRQGADLQTPHRHGDALVSAWTTLRSLVAARWRREQALPVPHAYLSAEPRKVEQWRAWLDGLGNGPKVGLQGWLDGPRAWEMPPEQALGAALCAAPIHIVSLQPSDTPDETAGLSEALGVQIHEPPGFDHSDFEDLAALVQALDVTVGPPAAATHLAGACGARVWILCPHGAWQTLGSGAYPWFPRAELFQAAPGPDWSTALARLEAAMGTLAAGHEQV